MMRKSPIKYIVHVVLCLIASISVRAQNLPNEDIVHYITQYADIAINEMVRTGVPASIKIAQGILETQAGKSKLVLESNNHFGIKCKSNWDGPKVYHDDDAQGECFRKYKDAVSSYKDHSDFLKLQPRYAALFELDLDDYTGWAWGLKKAGYATNPIYAETLIKFIEEYQLNQLNDYAEDEEQDKYDISDYIEEITKNGLTPSTGNNTAASSFASRKISYPEDVFKINSVKVIYAPAGSSLLAIAKKYNITLSKLLSYNELPKSVSVLKKSELVFLQPKKAIGNKSIHRVKRNESLRDISQHEGIKLSSLLQYNHLKANSKPSVGQKLNLKPKKGTSYKQPVKSTKKKKSNSKKKSRKK
jgi:LysM repeat protein